MHTKSGTKKAHFSYEDRVKIEGFLKEEYSYQEIAEAITRSKSAIGGEVKANGGRAKYTAVKAERRAALKQRTEEAGLYQGCPLALPHTVRGKDAASRMVARTYRVASAVLADGISAD